MFVPRGRPFSRIPNKRVCNRDSGSKQAHLGETYQVVNKVSDEEIDNDIDSSSEEQQGETHHIRGSNSRHPESAKPVANRTSTRRIMLSQVGFLPEAAMLGRFNLPQACSMQHS